MALKLNFSYPQHGSQKIIEFDDDKKVRIFADKRVSEEVAIDGLGDEFKGYVVKIVGGFDKQGFAMKQGVLTNHRVRLVLDGTTGMYRTPKRSGCRKRKSVRGCIVGPDLSCINLMIVKKGPQDLPGLTDPASDRPSMRGPKRASNIRKLWGLSKEEDVRQFVTKRKVTPKGEGKKPYVKAPKIQRLVTPVVLKRKKHRIALKKQRFDKNQTQAAEYAKLINQVRKEKRQHLLSKKRTEKESVKAETKAAPAKAAPAKENKAAPAKAEAKPKAVEKKVTPAQTQAQAAKPADKGVSKPAAAKKDTKKPAGGNKKQ
eukprot:TRINITY_DN2378_c0_g1_i1.p1 TRINITY_DN2378_c0_g1~~TRINITY_DN2378_c0_g1_i1.p1  ORF type:complete len:315 (+),score=87.58 TRINITY_DN2378_c0_g1_i1:61-1005(+)